MKNSFWSKYKILIIGIIMLVFSFGLEQSGRNIDEKLFTKWEISELENDIQSKEKLAKSIVGDLMSTDAIDLKSNLDKLLSISNQEHIFTYIYQDNSLKLYTSNKVLPSNRHQPEGIFILRQLANGYYLQMVKTELNLKYVILIPIQNNYPIENHYLSNNSLLETNEFKLATVQKPGQKYWSIKSIDGHVLFFMEQTKSLLNLGWLIYLYLLSGLILFAFFDRSIHYNLLRKRYLRAVLLFTAVLLLTIVVWQWLKFPKIFFRSELFSPQLYAKSKTIGSLADLMLLVFLSFWILNYVFNYIQLKKIRNRFYFWAASLVSLVILALGAQLAANIVKSLVIDSSLTLNMNSLEVFSFKNLAAFFVIYLTYYIIVRGNILFARYVLIHRPKRATWIILIFIPVILFFISKFYGQNPTFGIFLSSIALFLIISYPESRFNRLNTYIIYILLVSGLVSLHLQKANILKEHQNRQHMISKLASYRDFSGEQLLLQHVKRIEFDAQLFDLCNDSIPELSRIMRYLRKNYFTGYFSRYDMQVLLFDHQGHNMSGTSGVGLTQIENSLQNGEKIDTIKHLVFINSYDAAPEYLGHIHFKISENAGFNLYIYLKEKPFLEESVYPELLLNQYTFRNEDFKNYSYAIYKNGVLANQKGDYSYELELSEEIYNHAVNESFYDKNGYSHLAYLEQPGVIIVMSSKKANTFNTLSMFSVLFILGTIILAIIFGFTHEKKYADLVSLHRKVYWRSLLRSINLTFKSKIQITILLAVFFALLLTGFSSIRYVKNKQQQNTLLKLNKEINSIKNYLSDYFSSHNQYINRSNIDDISEEIKKLASLFHADINIFDTDGNLVTSSQLPIYEQQIISTKMDANAFYSLRIQQKSHYIQEEKIGGKIMFQSAYALIRNANNQITYFVNIPYLAKEEELKEEINSLVTTTVNLYVFLFLLITLVSFAISNTFTEPLELIKNHLSALQLGRSNKPIVWKSSDEIGSLIEEYNNMIAKVEESATRLAQTERESAWREMAKQVAHEIKNPLTPMKLSIQQLMRSWENKDERLDERFHKTARVLINRIDSLSQIATEFSQFARMPLPNNEEMLLENALKDIVALYANNQEVKVKLDLHTSDSLILADKEQLPRAFNNLIKNAIQAIPPDKEGRIVVTTRAKDNLVEISIKDNGSGIPVEIQDMIFKPNFSTKSSGMGLGLAIVARIIQNANGNIWFETTPGKGTSFYVELPLTNKDQIV